MYPITANLIDVCFIKKDKPFASQNENSEARRSNWNFVFPSSEIKIKQNNNSLSLRRLSR